MDTSVSLGFHNMFTFTITKNPNADLGYFDVLMRETYSTYDGYAVTPNTSYFTICTTEEYTQAQKTAVSNLNASLTADQTVDLKECRIYQFLDAQDLGNEITQAPVHIDYIRGLSDRLHVLVTSIYKGEVREITYYEDVIQNANGTLTGVNPIVRETFVYTRDVAKMAISRVMTIHWVNNDGTDNYISKTRTKYYSPQEKIVEGQKLRGNIIDFMQPQVLGMLMATENISYDDAVTMGAELFHAYSADISSWVYASRGDDLITKVTNDTAVTWLDNVINANGTTIRMYIIDQLNY